MHTLSMAIICIKLVCVAEHTAPAGEVMFGTDSHTCNAGAFGQFASGVGNTDAGFILGTGKLLIKVPQTLRFVLDGEMPPYLMAKDLILHIIGEIGVAGTLNGCPESFVSIRKAQHKQICVYIARLYILLVGLAGTSCSATAS